MIFKTHKGYHGSMPTTNFVVCGNKFSSKTYSDTHGLEIALRGYPIAIF